MKKIKLLAAIAALFLVACGGPTHAESEQIKAWVLMENINYPLDFISINDIVMQTDYVMYLDFAESFHELLDSNLIEYTELNGEKYYYVTERGRLVARELHSDILSTILDKSLEAAISTSKNVGSKRDARLLPVRTVALI